MVGKNLGSKFRTLANQEEEGKGGSKLYRVSRVLIRDITVFTNWTLKPFFDKDFKSIFNHYNATGELVVFTIYPLTMKELKWTFKNNLVNFMVQQFATAEMIDIFRMTGKKYIADYGSETVHPHLGDHLRNIAFKNYLAIFGTDKQILERRHVRQVRGANTHSIRKNEIEREHIALFQCENGCHILLERKKSHKYPVVGCWPGTKIPVLEGSPDYK